METVFDHNITEEEWNCICGLDKELYLKVVDEDSARLHLAFLYYRQSNDKPIYIVFRDEKGEKGAGQVTIQKSLSITSRFIGYFS